MKIIVLGLGNPLFRDDGVGWLVAQNLRTRINRSNITVQEFSGAGLDILDQVTGFEKAIIIDAICGGGGDVGAVYHFRIDEISTFGSVSPHEIDFIEAFKLGYQTGLAIPRDVSIFAIEAGMTERLGEEVSPAVNAAIPICVDLIIKEIMPG